MLCTSLVHVDHTPAKIVTGRGGPLSPCAHRGDKERGLVIDRVSSVYCGRGLRPDLNPTSRSSSTPANSGWDSRPSLFDHHLHRHPHPAKRQRRPKAHLSGVYDWRPCAVSQRAISAQRTCPESDAGLRGPRPGPKWPAISKRFWNAPRSSRQRNASPGCRQNRFRGPLRLSP